MRCRDLQGFAQACKSLISKGFSSPGCPGLHRIAVPVVSEWCQEPVDRVSPVPELEIRPIPVRAGTPVCARCRGWDSSAARPAPLLRFGSLSALV